MPDKEELDRTIKIGMTPEEINTLLGKPSRYDRKPGNDSFYLEYEVAPERIPAAKDGSMAPTGFKVEFENGKVVRWSHDIWSSASPAMKIVGEKPSTLKAIVPEFDLGAEDADVVEFHEKIRIPDLDQQVTRSDLISLLSAVHILSQTVDERHPALLTDCDMVKLLSKHIPEIAKLADSHKKAIPLTELGHVVKPFVLGERPIPEPNAKTEP